MRTDGWPFDSRIIAGHIAESLDGVLPANVHLESWNRLGDNEGFLSDIFKISVTYKNIEHSKLIDSLPKSLVLKIPNSERAMEDADGMDMAGGIDVADPAFIGAIHDKECLFYDYIASDAMPKPPPIPLPKCYAAVREKSATSIPCILMEDLSSFSRVQPVVDALSDNQIWSVVNVMAKFHAHCIVHRSSWINLGFEANTWDIIQGFAPLINHLSDTMRAQYASLFTVPKSVVDAMLNEDQLFEKEFLPHVGKYVPVITNGDLWTHNVMFTLSEDKKITDEVRAVLDWQFASVGSVTLDMARLIVTSVSVDWRRLNTQNLLNVYYNAVLSETSALGMQTAPFTMDQLLSWWRNSMKVSALLVLIDLPTALIKYASASSKGQSAVADVIGRGVAFLEDAYQENYL